MSLLRKWFVLKISCVLYFFLLSFWFVKIINECIRKWLEMDWRTCFTIKPKQPCNPNSKCLQNLANYFIRLNCIQWAHWASHLDISSILCELICNSWKPINYVQMMRSWIRLLTNKWFFIHFLRKFQREHFVCWYTVPQKGREFVFFIRC